MTQASEKQYTATIISEVIDYKSSVLIGFSQIIGRHGDRPRPLPSPDVLGVGRARSYVSDLFADNPRQFKAPPK